MAARANYVKIGLFVMLGFGALAAIGIVIGVQRLRRETVSYYTYFNEAVAGLDVGAPVKARGVTIGQVGNITFAPDQRMVEVRSDLDVALLMRAGLRKTARKDEPLPMPPDLRAQLASQGLTGTRYLALDLFDPETNPVPKLTFPTPENYIPAARSIQKSLEESVSRAMDSLAEVADTLAREEIGEKLVRTTAHADEALVSLNHILQNVRREELPSHTVALLANLQVASKKLNQVLDRLNGETGLLSATQRSVSAVGEAGRSTAQATRDVDSTLTEIRSAAEAIRSLADALEREPDMLVKGRAPRGRR
jgi:ABC-type transporter Mla subunit MlaD